MLCHVSSLNVLSLLGFACLANLTSATLIGQDVSRAEVMSSLRKTDSRQ